jgi:glycosyltransferase involved in cell wall biosynthesis
MEYLEREYPFVSIIVVVLNMESTIYRCLSSLTSLSYPKERYEIVVVDGGSTDQTLTICREFGLRCVVEKKRGRGLARNLGIKSSKGEIVAFVDADCTACRDWLSVHVASYRDSTIGAVTGAVVNPYLSSSTKPAILMHYENFAEFDESLKRRYTYHAPTCNTSFRRSVLESVGFFDEKLDAYEDFVLSKRITNAGYRILFEPNARVMHFGIIPKMTTHSYLTRERKLGAAHFRAQTFNKFIFPRLPMNRHLVLPIVPLIIIARATRELYKLLRVRRLAPDIFAVPYLVLGSIMWGSSYFHASRVAGKDRHE